MLAKRQAAILFHGLLLCNPFSIFPSPLMVLQLPKTLMDISFSCMLIVRITQKSAYIQHSSTCR